MDGRKKSWTKERRAKQRLNALRAGFFGNRKGAKNSDEQKQKQSIMMKGLLSDETKHPLWAADKPSYRVVHMWVEKWRGKPDTCEKCGRKGLKGHSIQWANIDHTYKRILDDYIRLCAKCHDAYDKERDLRGK